MAVAGDLVKPDGHYDTYAFCRRHDLLRKNAIYKTAHNFSNRRHVECLARSSRFI
ncbi:hypothetical protein Plhal304r1_c003g0009461 [Plasmopara halstedii]